MTARPATHAVYARHRRQKNGAANFGGPFECPFMEESRASDGELTRQPQLGLAQLVAAAADVAVGAEREHDEVFG